MQPMLLGHRSRRFFFFGLEQFAFVFVLILLLGCCSAWTKNSSEGAKAAEAVNNGQLLAMTSATAVAAEPQRHSPRVPEEEDEEDSQINEIKGAGRMPWEPIAVQAAMVGSDGSSSNLEDCPGSCFCDETGIYVSCVGERAWDLSLPAIPTSVVRLEIRSFRLGSLHSSLVERLAKVEELKLQQTAIESLGNGTFARLQKLARLDLAENHLRNLSARSFVGLEASLRFLDLSSNNLTLIDDAFLKLALLEQLNLRNNKLSSLAISTFLGLGHLQYLNLDGNAITTIEVGAFIHLPHLAHLLLSNNPLSSLSRLDSVSTKLQYIDISAIGLVCIPQGIDPFVRDLRLARNKIGNISSGDLDNYPYLSLLVLDDNAIEAIEDDALGRLEYLIRLWLNGNKLNQVPLSLPTSLRELYLEENQIRVISANSFAGLINLQRLFMRRNGLHTIEPGAFADLVALQVLDLQTNSLEDALAEPLLANASRLESLDISHNVLNQLTRHSFSGLTNLKTLQLSRVPTPASLLRIDEELFVPLVSLENLDLSESEGLVQSVLASNKTLASLRTVQELNLAHNNLRTLRGDFSNYFKSIKMIKFNENKWSCDRELLGLVQWMKGASPSVHFYLSYDIKCSSPASLASKPLMTLNIEELRPQQNSSKSALSTAPMPSIQATTPHLSLVRLPTQAPVASASSSSPVPIEQFTTRTKSAAMTVSSSPSSPPPLTRVSLSPGADERGVAEKQESSSPANGSSESPKSKQLSPTSAFAVNDKSRPSTASSPTILLVKNDSQTSEKTTSYYFQSAKGIAKTDPYSTLSSRVQDPTRQATKLTDILSGQGKEPQRLGKSSKVLNSSKLSVYSLRGAQKAPPKGSLSSSFPLKQEDNAENPSKEEQRPESRMPASSSGTSRGGLVNSSSRVGVPSPSPQQQSVKGTLIYSVARTTNSSPPFQREDEPAIDAPNLGASGLVSLDASTRTQRTKDNVRSREDEPPADNYLASVEGSSLRGPFSQTTTPSFEQFEGNKNKKNVPANPSLSQQNDQKLEDKLFVPFYASSTSGRERKHIPLKGPHKDLASSSLAISHDDEGLVAAAVAQSRLFEATVPRTRAEGHSSPAHMSSANSSKEFTAFLIVLLASVCLTLSGIALAFSYSALVTRQRRRRLIHGSDHSCGRTYLRSNVAYSPQKDEVSIVAVDRFEGFPRRGNAATGQQSWTENQLLLVDKQNSCSSSRLYLEEANEPSCTDEMMVRDPLLPRAELLPLSSQSDFGSASNSSSLASSSFASSYSSSSSSHRATRAAVASLNKW